MNYKKLYFFLFTISVNIIGMYETNPFHIAQDMPHFTENKIIKELKQYTDNNHVKELKQYIKYIFPEDTDLPTICTSTDNNFIKSIKNILPAYKEIFNQKNSIALGATIFESIQINNSCRKSIKDNKEKENNVSLSNILIKNPLMLLSKSPLFNHHFSLKNQIVLLNQMILINAKLNTPDQSNHTSNGHKVDTIIHETIHHKLSKNKSFFYETYVFNKINPQIEEEFLVCYLTTYSFLYHNPENFNFIIEVLHSYEKKSPHQLGMIAALKDIANNKIESCTSNISKQNLDKIGNASEDKIISRYKKTINNCEFPKEIKLGKQTLRQILNNK